MIAEQVNSSGSVQWQHSIAVVETGAGSVAAAVLFLVLLLSSAGFLLPLQVLPPDVSTWDAVELWLRQGGAGGEVLLVCENTEDVLLHDKCSEVSVICFAVLCCAGQCSAVQCRGL